MDLLGIRKKVVGISGRYDLVVDSVDYADNGMDYYIQNAQKHLEREIGIIPATAKIFQAIAKDAFLATFANCRSVQTVYAIDENSRTKVVRKTAEEMKALYVRYADNLYAEDPTLIGTGRPIYYCPTNLRRSPSDEDGSGDAASLSSYLDTVSPADPTLMGIVLAPPADKTYTLEISGLFYDTVLTNNTDENYWSSQYPMLLVRATLRELAVDFAGSKTVRDWDAIIADELLGIEKDAIDQEIAETDEMNG